MGPLDIMSNPAGEGRRAVRLRAAHRIEGPWMSVPMLFPRHPDASRANSSSPQAHVPDLLAGPQARQQLQHGDELKSRAIESAQRSRMKSQAKRRIRAHPVDPAPDKIERFEQ